MVGQMMIQGAMTLMMGLFLAVAGPALFTMIRLDSGPKNPQDEKVATVVSIIYLLLGLAVIFSAILTIIAGIRGLKFRGRTLAIVALFSNIIPLFTCYCAPTSLGVMIYGLIVMFNADVARAYQMADEGKSPQEIQQAF